MTLPLEGDTQLFDRDMLERNILTYTHLWQRALTGGGGANSWVVSIDTLRNIFYQCWTNLVPRTQFGTYYLSTGVAIFESPAAANYIGNLINCDVFSFVSNSTARHTASSHARYVVILRDDRFNLEIWKDGALLQGINIQVYDVGALVTSMTMSQDGRWLLVLTDTPLLHCFRGD